MFTGIITDIGTIANIQKDVDWRIEINTQYDTSTITLGASIACSGVCLTVTETTKNSFFVDVSAESLSCTTIGDWQPGQLVNLERALKVGDELGGHIVSGHVDAKAHATNITPEGDSHIIEFTVPQDLKLFIAAKGSVTLDGVSLTVNKVVDKNFTVNIIPHTWENTTFKNLQNNSAVNLEIDTLARYVARLRE